MRVLVLVSGGGTNLQAIIDGVADGTITNTEIVGVLSNNYGVYSLERAEKAGIKNEVISPKDFPDRSAFNKAFLEKLNEYDPDLIVLAGFLVVIPEIVINKYEGRIINIHHLFLHSVEQVTMDLRFIRLLLREGLRYPVQQFILWMLEQIQVLSFFRKQFMLKKEIHLRHFSDALWRKLSGRYFHRLSTS